MDEDSQLGSAPRARSHATGTRAGYSAHRGGRLQCNARDMCVLLSRVAVTLRRVWSVRSSVMARGGGPGGCVTTVVT